MKSICFYFQIHQPFQLASYNFDQIGERDNYDNINLNKDLIDSFSNNCYLPANKQILEMIKRTKGKFKVAFSISGTTLDQFELYRPDVLKSFKALIETGSVEILAETYYHSLSSLYSPEEFSRQVKMHRDKIIKLFSVTPVVFRNTEQIYSNAIAVEVAKLGFKGIVCEGADSILNGRSTSQVFTSPKLKDFGLLLKNRSLSEDIAIRFSNKSWTEHPLSPGKFATWLHGMDKESEVINLFMKYETFGKRHGKETGIFDFLNQLPEEILTKKGFEFKTPSQVLASAKSKEVYDVSSPISWTDCERDLSVWLENKMQLEALEKVYSIEQMVLESGNKTIINEWGKIQASDHFYNMSFDKKNSNTTSSFTSPYDAHIYYMNIVSDIEEAVLSKKEPATPLKEKGNGTKKVAVVPKKTAIATKTVKLTPAIAKKAVVTKSAVAVKAASKTPAKVVKAKPATAIKKTPVKKALVKVKPAVNTATKKAATPKKAVAAKVVKKAVAVTMKTVKAAPKKAVAKKAIPVKKAAPQKAKAVVKAKAPAKKAVATKTTKAVAKAKAPVKKVASTKAAPAVKATKKTAKPVAKKPSSPAKKKK